MSPDGDAGPAIVPGSPGGIVVLRLSSVGDIVLTEPALSVLRETFPGSEIGFVVKEQYRDLVSAHPAVGRVHVLSGSASGDMRRLALEIRAARYDVAVDLHHNFRTLSLLRASRVPAATRYRKRELRDGIGVRLLRRPFRASSLLVRRYLDALIPLGVSAEAFTDEQGRIRRPKLYLAEEHLSEANGVLARHGLAGSPYAVLVPGAMWPTKRWPWDRYAAVASGFVSEFGLPAVLLGSAAESGLCDRVARKAGPGVVSVAGDATLGAAGAMISGARLYVGNDSGPTHMAVALDVPTVAIFGPTDPGQFDHTGHALIYRDLQCSACSFYGGRRCPLGHWDCMLTIEPEDVLRAAGRLLPDVRRRQGERA